MSHPKKPMDRVSRISPCPICKKTDWCMVGDRFVVCMRVASRNESNMADGSIGYLHQKQDAVATDYKKPERPRAEFKLEVLERCQKIHGTEPVRFLAKHLGVTHKSLELLGCSKWFDRDTWAFPMRSADGKITGARIRHVSGKKWSIPGSYNGLFIPQTEVQPEVIIVEGESDVAAALSIGFYAVGRFNCCGGIDMINDFIKLNKVKRAHIVADCDQDRVINGAVANPGIRGAITLSEHLIVPNRIVTLPAKDMRDFVSHGGTPAVFKAVADQIVWNRPR